MLTLRFGSISMDWRALLFFLHVRHTVLQGPVSIDLLSPREWQENITREYDTDDTGPPRYPLVPIQHRLNRNYQRAHMNLQKVPALSPRRAFDYQMLVIVMLHRKRLLQHEAKRRQIPIAIAMFSFSDQQCSVPHDSVYGILGLCTSRLDVDYNMPLLETRIRVLMELNDEVESSDSAVTPNVYIDYPAIILSTFSALQRLVGVVAAALIVSQAINSSSNTWSLVFRHLGLIGYQWTKKAYFARARGWIDALTPRKSTSGPLEIAGAKIDSQLNGLVAGSVCSVEERLYILFAYTVERLLRLCKRYNTSPYIMRRAKESPPGVRTYTDWVRYIEDLRRDVDSRSVSQDAATTRAQGQ